MSVSEETNGLAWERLGGAAKKRKCVTLMINALENAGLLLPEVIHENKEVTVASPNIRKPISISITTTYLESRETFLALSWESTSYDQS